MKKIEEMSDRELLEELLKEKRKNQILRYIGCAILLAVAIFIYVEAMKYIPMIRDFVDRSNKLMAELEETSNQINGMVDSLNDGTIEKLKEMIDKLSELMNIFKF